MKQIAWMVLLSVAPTLAAQQNADTGRAVPVERLRQEIRQRWHTQVRQQLNLSDDQAARLQGTEDRFFPRRREIQQRQHEVLQALRGQLQPGMEASADSVRKLLEARDANRSAVAQLERDEENEMKGYLSPVQLARYQFMRQRLQERIADMRRQRRQRFLGPEHRPQR